MTADLSAAPQVGSPPATANSSEPSRPAKHQRSLAATVLVRTVLLGLLAAVAWQWYARDSFSRTLAALDAQVDEMRDSILIEKSAIEREAEEKGETITSPEVYAAVRERMKYVTASEVPRFICGFPSRIVTEQISAAGPMRREIYVWRGPLQTYELYVNYELGDDPRLVTVDTEQ